jgi:ribosomal protein S18 acetylase RimI-like enzyme
MLVGSRVTPALARLGVALRPEEAGDLDWIAALYASTRADELAAAPWPDTVKAHFLADQFRLQHVHFQSAYPQADRLIVLARGERAGRLVVERGRSPWRLVDIALDPLHRSRGIGRALIGWLQREGRRDGIDLHVARDNLGAARLYARLGFMPADGGSPTHARMAWPGRVS